LAQAIFPDIQGAYSVRQRGTIVPSGSLGAFYTSRGPGEGTFRGNVFHVPSPPGKGEKVAVRPDEGDVLEFIG